jgi:crotonobetainyl-CoA:carnitine CoA-transferase CaiB-like acyl-CoA transferase
MGTPGEPRAAGSGGDDRAGPLTGVRVIEVGAPAGEYCGLLLAGLGAEVIKVEPPSGSPSRKIGPFPAGKDDGDSSLFFLAYNRAKRSVSVDVDSDDGYRQLTQLASTADVWLESATSGPEIVARLEPAALRETFPRLVVARMTPFGDAGPWADYRATDLVSLALGGVLMNCGYDPGIDGTYDLPPSWPHAFHSFHIAGEQLAMGIMTALYWRLTTGQGQFISCSVHEAVSKCTEVDLMSWVMLRQPFFRQTCRHSAPEPVTAPTIAQTKDGRWLNAMSLSDKDRGTLRRYLAGKGIGEAPDESGEPPSLARKVPGTGNMGSEEELRDIELVQRLTRRSLFADLPWREAQEDQVMWAPVRKPHESLADDHWQARRTFEPVEHPERGGTLLYPARKWLSTEPSWSAGRRAPALGADNDLLPDMTPPQFAPPAAAGAVLRAIFTSPRSRDRGPSTPWALEGVRILDFSWFLASAGGTRFLSAFGADCIKVEWRANPDTRLGAGAPVGGRAARDAATAPLDAIHDPDMGGNFNHKNAGKRGISLNVRHPEGLEIAKLLVAKCDIVAEGFSPGVMDRWGLGYDVLRQINPRIIYAQQSGMGAQGTYGRTRAVGPIAASLSGLSEMSGQPEPAPPAGWGYSYLDWLGAYSFASAMIAALYHREVTGRGQYVDASQCEAGIFTTAVPILDWQLNGGAWRRPGNRSPYLPAAPEGVYRCQGQDRWIAISCPDDEAWQALARVIDRAQWSSRPEFASLAGRLSHPADLDRVISQWTQERDAYDVMHALQGAGVPAGVCQTAQDRCDSDPQLKSLEWLTEVTGSKIGTWPVGEVAVRMSRTPGYIGGRIDRGAPCYGEDTGEVLGEMLGLTEREVAELARRGVV